MSEKFVIVHRSSDPILIEHLGEMLRESGVSARVLGTRDAALIGVGRSIVELNITVPEVQAGEAADFIEAFFADEGAVLLQREGLLDEDDDEEEESFDDRKLSPTLAGVAVLFCGLGHVYARRRVTGALLALTFVGLMLGGARLTEHGGLLRPMAIPLALFALVLFDLIGSQFAVRAHNRGTRRSTSQQMVRAAVFVALAAVVAWLPNLGGSAVGSAGADGSLDRMQEPISRDRSQHVDAFGFPTRRTVTGLPLMPSP